MYRTHATLLTMAASLFVVATGRADTGAAALNPFAGDRPFSPANRIDHLVSKEWLTHDIQPAALCPDTVFIRRAYIDVIGTLPKPQAVRNFLASPDPAKRSALIDDLMRRGEFADYWTLKWCDLLRVKAEFPINLWPNGVQAYARWIHTAVRDNMPYDRFTRELLTSSGSNFRVPPVNFYRAIQGEDPSAIAGAVAHLHGHQDRWLDGGATSRHGGDVLARCLQEHR